MLVEERRQRVLDLVNRQGFVSLADLAQAIQVSASTIRRDLDHLDQKGLIKRTHGGAMLAGLIPAEAGLVSLLTNSPGGGRLLT